MNRKCFSLDLKGVLKILFVNIKFSQCVFFKPIFRLLGKVLFNGGARENKW